MKNQFNVLINFKSLANAAAFLQREGLAPRSRNNLVNQCVGYLEALAEKHGCSVASDELSGVEFLVANGLAGEAGKAAVGITALTRGKELKENDYLVQQVVDNIKRDRKMGKRVEVPDYMQPTEANILDAASRCESESEALELAEAAFGSEAITEAVKEKVSKLFIRKSNYSIIE